MIKTVFDKNRRHKEGDTVIWTDDAQENLSDIMRQCRSPFVVVSAIY